MLKSTNTKTYKKEASMDMEIVLSAVSVCVTSVAAILSYLSFRSTERAQKQDADIQLLGKREKTLFLLKSWYDKVDAAFKKKTSGRFGILLAFRTELLSVLEDEYLSLYSAELKRYDYLLTKSEDKGQKDEIVATRRETYLSKLIAILISMKQVRREINSTGYIFSLTEVDVSKIECFTNAYCTMAEEIISHEQLEDKQILEREGIINNGFEALRDAHKALCEATVLEKMEEQLSELRNSFGG